MTPVLVPDVFLLRFADLSEARYTALASVMVRARRFMGLIREADHDRTRAWPSREIILLREPAPILWLEWASEGRLPVGQLESGMLTAWYLGHVIGQLTQTSARS